MSKNEPAAELEEQGVNEAKYRSAIPELQELKKEGRECNDYSNELKSSNETNYNPQVNLEERSIKVERRMPEQEQH